MSVRGTDEATRVRESEAWTAVLAAPDGELTARFAEYTERVLHRAAAILALAEAAARGDAQLAPLRDRGHAAQRELLSAFAGELARRGRWAGDADELAAGLFALTGEGPYLRLVVDCGRSRADYVRWLTAAVDGLLMRAA